MSQTGWDRAEAQVKRGPFRAFIFVFLGLLFMAIVVGTVGFGMNFFKQGALIVEKTIDADNVIANYEWFKQRYQDIQAVDAKVSGAVLAASSFVEFAGERSSWHREDREEHSRLNSILLGLRQQHSDLAAEYNARSRMANRNIFKLGDAELPGTINIEGN